MLAFIATAKPEKRAQTQALLIPSCITAVVAGITEPLEFSFLFVAPVLYVIHALLCGLAYVLTYLVEFNVPGPSAFGGPFLSWIFNGIMNADKGSNWFWLIPLGVAYFGLYYALFRVFIAKFDFKTPGREDDTDEASAGAESSGSTQTNELIPQIVEAVGGKANIKSVDACFTRLRLKLNDASLVKEDPYFKESLGASAIVHVGDGVQIVYGNKASVYKSEMREYLGME